MSLKYHQLDSSVEKQIKENISKGILSSYRFMDENAVRRNMEKDKNSVLRPSFGRDIEKILHLPLYNSIMIKRRYFHSTTMMISLDEACTFSLCHG